MENASRAIIMAAGILIGVIVLSIGVYLFSIFGTRAADIQREIDGRVLAEFNNRFLKYESSEACTIHDIISLTNFAKKTNQAFDFDNNNINDRNNPYYLHVYIKKGAKMVDLTTYTEEQIINELKENSTYEEKNITTGEVTAGIQYYTCKQILYENDTEPNRVSGIVFEKNK